MRRLAAAVLLVLAFVSFARAAELPQVGLNIDPPDGEVGSLLTVRLTVSGEEAADCTLIETPVVAGARLTLASGGTTSMTSTLINGRLTSSLRVEWIFELVPERTGRIEVGPFRLNSRGGEVRSRVAAVQVRASTLASDTVGLQLRAGTEEVWLGQTFALDVVASIDARAYDEQCPPNGLELDLPWLAGVPGLLRLESPEPLQDSHIRVRLAGTNGYIRMLQSTSTATGKPRYVLSRSFIMLATAPGEVRLPASRFSATLATQVQQERDPFSILGGNRLRIVRSATVDARSEGPPLRVREPPVDGRPASWVNAVGRFQFTGVAAPTSLRVGDTCTLTLSLAGDGNVDFLEWPDFDVLERDFRIFGKTPRKPPRTQVLEIQVSPKSERVTQLPALEWSFFDPETARYETRTVGPWPLTVLPGGSDGLSTLESRAETMSTLVTVREALPEASGGPPAGWLLMLPGLALLAGVELVARRRRWTLEHAGEVSRRGARRRLQEALDAARDAHELALAFGKYLSARLGGPPAGLSAEEASTRLPDAALAQELRAIVGRWEAASFGGAALDLQAARAEAARLADRVEAAT